MEGKSELQNETNGEDIPSDDTVIEAGIENQDVYAAESYPRPETSHLQEKVVTCNKKSAEKRKSCHQQI